jgi:hypothetical protein
MLGEIQRSASPGSSNVIREQRLPRLHVVACFHRLVRNTAGLRHAREDIRRGFQTAGRGAGDRVRDDRGDGRGKLRGIDQTGRGRAPLVRHIYDLHVIREHYDAADVATLLGEIMQSDAERRQPRGGGFRDSDHDTENVGSHLKRAVSMTPSKRNVVVGTRLLAIQAPFQRFIVL